GRGDVRPGRGVLRVPGGGAVRPEARVVAAGGRGRGAGGRLPSGAPPPLPRGGTPRLGATGPSPRRILGLDAAVAAGRVGLGRHPRARRAGPAGGLGGGGRRGGGMARVGRVLGRDPRPPGTGADRPNRATGLPADRARGGVGRGG